MEIIELLISGNDGVNIQDAYGSIALHYAAKEGDTKVIELLINHGADVIATAKAVRTLCKAHLP